MRAEGARLVVVIEGRDAAGKGRTSKRVAEHLNPRVPRIVALPKPTERERTQWYFQRYAEHLPSAGEIVLFDRSWYNRAGGGARHGLLHQGGAPAVPAAVPDLRADAGGGRDPAAQVLVLPRVCCCRRSPTTSRSAVADASNRTLPGGPCPSAVRRCTSTDGYSAATSFSAASSVSAAPCSCWRAGSPARRGWSAVWCAGHRQARTASSTAPRRSASSKAKRTAAEHCASSPTPSRMHQPQRHPAQGGLVRRPVDGPQTRLGFVHAHDQREFHGAVVHLVHGGFF